MLVKVQLSNLAQPHTDMVAEHKERKMCFSHLRVNIHHAVVWLSLPGLSA